MKDTGVNDAGASSAAERKAHLSHDLRGHSEAALYFHQIMNLALLIVSRGSCMLNIGYIGTEPSVAHYVAVPLEITGGSVANSSSKTAIGHKEEMSTMAQRENLQVGSLDRPAIYKDAIFDCFLGRPLSQPPPLSTCFCCSTLSCPLVDASLNNHANVKNDWKHVGFFFFLLKVSINEP